MATADGPARLERTGIERIDEDVRNSTPWMFFTMFLGASVALAGFVYGWIPITLGLGMSSLGSILVGAVVGVVLLIPLTVIGSETATTHFGVRGRLIASFIGQAVMITVTTVAVWTGGGILVGPLSRLIGLPGTDVVRIIVYCGIAVVAALIAIYGYHDATFWTREGERQYLSRYPCGGIPGARGPWARSRPGPRHCREGQR